jgi:hypothetical protein
MQPSHRTWGSEGAFGYWRYRYAWRYGLVGLVLGLAIIVLAIRGHWADVGWPLATSGFRSFVACTRGPTRPWSCSATPRDRSTGSASGCSRRWPAQPANSDG